MRNLREIRRFIVLNWNHTKCSRSIYSQNYKFMSSLQPNCPTTRYDNRLLVQKEVINTLQLRHVAISKQCFAKSKDRGGKEKKKAKSSKVDLRELAEMFDVDSMNENMRSAIEKMKMDFVKNLTVRSTTGAIDEIPVKVDGKEYQLQELAQIGRKPKLIVLNLASFPASIPHVIQAIQKSGLNVNPQQDGTTVFLPIPKVTKEHRENLSKGARAIHIRYRDQIKDIRSKAIKALSKKDGVSQDQVRRMQAQIETLSDKFLKEAEMILETKQNELLGSNE